MRTQFQYLSFPFKFISIYFEHAFHNVFTESCYQCTLCMKFSNWYVSKFSVNDGAGRKGKWRKYGIGSLRKSWTWKEWDLDSHGPADFPRIHFSFSSKRFPLPIFLDQAISKEKRWMLMDYDWKSVCHFWKMLKDSFNRQQSRVVICAVFFSSIP